MSKDISKKYNKIFNVIHRGCILKYHYSDSQGRTCVIGSLAKSAGISLPQVEGTIIDSESLYDFSKKICEEYKLNIRQLSALQRFNDTIDSIDTRRRVIAAFLDYLKSEEEYNLSHSSK